MQRRRLVALLGTGTDEGLGSWFWPASRNRVRLARGCVTLLTGESAPSNSKRSLGMVYRWAVPESATPTASAGKP